MIRGITPIDTAFEIAGLIQAGNIIRFLFVETLIGKIAILLSCLLSLKQSLLLHNWQNTIFYIVFLLSLCLLMIPTTVIGRVSYTADESWIQESRMEMSFEFLQENQGKAPLFLNFLSQSMMIFTKNMISIVDSFRRDGLLYLKQPMGKTQVFYELYRTIQQGIQQKDLREKMIVFYQDVFLMLLKTHCYLPTDRQTLLWPGHPEIVALYTETQQKQWDQIAQEILMDMNRGNPILDKIEKVYQLDRKFLEDRLLKEVFQQELRLHHPQYRMKNWITSVKSVVQRPFLISRPSLLFLYGIEKSFWVQGVFLFVGYALFPVILLGFVVLKQWVYLWVYCLSLAGGRFVNVIWALLDQASGFFLKNFLQQEVLVFDKALYFLEGVSWAMLLVPLMLWMCGSMFVTIQIQNSKRKIV